MGSETKQHARGRARVAVVASDELRLAGLMEIVGSSERVEPVGCTLPAVAADRGIAAVILDSAATVAPLGEVVATLRRERPELSVVVLGSNVDPEYIQSVIGSGARGYLSAAATESEIRMALEIVLDGSVWAPRKVLAQLLDAQTREIEQQRTGEKGSVFRNITRRETDVLELLMQGRPNREIAAELGIDPATVKAYLGRLMRKTGAANRVELSLRAVAERDRLGSRD